MHRHCLAFVVSMLAGSGFATLPGSAASGPPADDVRLTLSRQTVWQGEYGWCSFTAEIVQRRGAVSSRCGGAGPFGTASPGPGASAEHRRTLTDSETATLHKLYEEAHLFDGGHIGADHSGSDLPFHILIVRSSSPNRAVVLVLTGNPTFSSGPRKALLDWLTRESGLIG
jgi:hypothetical protein